MADAFIGFTILITLQYPPNAQLQGVVANVLDQKLFLRDGMPTFALEPRLHHAKLTCCQSSCSGTGNVSPHMSSSPLPLPTSKCRRPNPLDLKRKN